MILEGATGERRQLRLAKDASCDWQNTPVPWLRWAARAEAVVHLDDLLLRRVRVGLTLPNGGLDCLERIRATVQGELGWDDLQWAFEADRYRELWNRCYHLKG